MKKNIRLITTGIVILGIGAFSGYSLFASDRETPKEAAPKAQSIEEIQANQGKPVKVASVSQQNIEVTQTFYGTAAPFARTPSIQAPAAWGKGTGPSSKSRTV